jgi:hypothetical protein
MGAEARAMLNEENLTLKRSIASLTHRYNSLKVTAEQYALISSEEIESQQDQFSRILGNSKEIPRQVQQLKEKIQYQHE